MAISHNLPQTVCSTDERSRFVGKVTDDGIEWDLLSEKQLTAVETSAFVQNAGAGLRLDHQQQSVEEFREIFGRSYL